MCSNLTAIAYYNGGEKWTASSSRLRPRYLAATIANARSFSQRVVVGVVTREDRETVLGLGVTDDDCWFIEGAVDYPPDLPLCLCRRLQETLILDPDSVVCYTEADQRTTFGVAHAEFLKSRPHEERASLTGHRLEQRFRGHPVGHHLLMRPPPRDFPPNEVHIDLSKNETWKNETWNNETWVFANEVWPVRGYPSHSAFRAVADRTRAYSAFFACTARTLGRVVFTCRGPKGPAPSGFSLESAFYSVHESGVCYKTNVVLPELGGLVTLHLGGREHFARAVLGDEFETLFD